MAKKKKKSKAGTSAAVPGAGAPKPNDAALVATANLREEYDRGSYAGVRRLALTLADGDDATQRLSETLVERTHVDMVQLGVGIAAFLVAVGVGLATLTY